MTVKYGILDTEQRKRWLERFNTIPFRPRIAVRVKKMKSQFEEAVKQSREVRQELLDEYGIQNEDGSITVPRKNEGEKGYERWIEFKDRWEELLNDEIEFSPWQVFTEQELEELEDIQLTGNDIENLDFLGAIKWLDQPEESKESEEPEEA